MKVVQAHSKTALARKGEELAAEHLVKKGFVVVERNYRIGQGEMDIIARHGNWLVVVEVKTRESNFLTNPLQLVPLSKQKQLIKLANAYLKMRKTLEQVRFDIVIVVHNAQYTTIEHIEDAFYPMG